VGGELFIGEIAESPDGFTEFEEIAGREPGLFKFLGELISIATPFSSGGGIVCTRGGGRSFQLESWIGGKRFGNREEGESLLISFKFAEIFRRVVIRMSDDLTLGITLGTALRIAGDPHWGCGGKQTAFPQATMKTERERLQLQNERLTVGAGEDDWRSEAGWQQWLAVEFHAGARRIAGEVSEDAVSIGGLSVAPELRRCDLTATASDSLGAETRGSTMRDSPGSTDVRQYSRLRL
jgi:hypothetical protein